MARYTDSIKSISTVINFNKYSDLRVSIFVRNGGTNCMCQSDAIQCSILQLSILKWKINICLCSIGTHDEFHKTLSLSLFLSCVWERNWNFLGTFHVALPVTRTPRRNVTTVQYRIPNAAALLFEINVIIRVKPYTQRCEN